MAKLKSAPAQQAAARGRKVRINGIAGSGDDMLDYARILWVVPSMDGLFTGGASDRRRFLDRMVLAIDTAHGKRVLDYEKRCAAATAC